MEMKAKYSSEHSPKTQKKKEESKKNIERKLGRTVASMLIAAFKTSQGND